MRHHFLQGELRVSSLYGEPVSNDTPDICEQMGQLDWILMSVSLLQPTRQWSLVREHQWCSSRHCLVLLCHKAAVNHQHTEQICILSCLWAAGDIHISYKFLRPVLSCMSPWLDSFIARAWLETRCFCQQMRTSIRADTSYVLFIALGLT